MRPFARLRARLRAIRILEPLANRDYRLLTTGAFVSLLGDGFFSVALAWQVYQISNVPTALSIVGVAWTLPLVDFLLLSGVLTDRYDRRWLMIGADLVRAAAVIGLGLLSITGAIQLWHVVVLIAFMGAGDAFFNPASTAIVPDLLAAERLPQANALQGTVRPLMIRLIGPAIGGFVVAVLGPGSAFLVDGASFVLSATALLAIRARPSHVASSHGLRSAFAEMGEGFRFVVANPWCWATLVSAMLSLLVFIGPVQVLLPYLVKNHLHLGADSLGLLYAVSGVGAILSALAVGQLGIPRLRITFMYASWAVGVGLFAGYGVMTALWQGFFVAFATAGLFEIGSILWTP